MQTANPILAEAIRGSLVESFYRGAYAIVNFEGHLVDAAGDIDRLIYGRSSLKPLQSLAIVASGATRRYGLSLQKLALSCASHNGEANHIYLAKKWLECLGWDEGVLECGPIWPAHSETAYSYIKNNHQPSRLYHMCSGKHLGFLSVAAHQGITATGYTDWHHPVQIYNRDLLSEVCDIDLHQAPHGIDGCQASVIALSLRSFAKGLAQLAAPQRLNMSLQTACQEVVAAMSQYPHFVAGTERFCTDIALQSQGQILAKMGAEGVFSAIIPSRGWGIALKIDDGHMKAAEVALAKVLNQHALLYDKKFLNPAITNSNQQQVGWWQ